MHQQQQEQYQRQQHNPLGQIYHQNNEYSNHLERPSMMFTSAADSVVVGMSSKPLHLCYAPHQTNTVLLSSSSAGGHTELQQSNNKFSSNPTHMSTVYDGNHRRKDKGISYPIIFQAATVPYEHTNTLGTNQQHPLTVVPPPAAVASDATNRPSYLLQGDDKQPFTKSSERRSLRRANRRHSARHHLPNSAADDYNELEPNNIPADQFDGISFEEHSYNANLQHHTHLRHHNHPNPNTSKPVFPQQHQTMARHHQEQLEKSYSMMSSEWKHLTHPDTEQELPSYSQRRRLSRTMSNVPFHSIVHSQPSATNFLFDSFDHASHTSNLTRKSRRHSATDMNTCDVWLKNHNQLVYQPNRKYTTNAFSDEASFNGLDDPDHIDEMAMRIDRPSFTTASNNHQAKDHFQNHLKYSSDQSHLAEPNVSGIMRRSDSMRSTSNDALIPFSGHENLLIYGSGQMHKRISVHTTSKHRRKRLSSGDEPTGIGGAIGAFATINFQHQQSNTQQETHNQHGTMNFVDTESIARMPRYAKLSNGRSNSGAATAAIDINNNNRMEVDKKQKHPDLATTRATAPPIANLLSQPGMRHIAAASIHNGCPSSYFDDQELSGESNTNFHHYKNFKAQAAVNGPPYPNKSSSVLLTSTAPNQQYNLNDFHVRSVVDPTAGNRCITTTTTNNNSTTRNNPLNESEQNVPGIARTATDVALKADVNGLRRSATGDILKVAQNPSHITTNIYSRKDDRVVIKFPSLQSINRNNTHPSNHSDDGSINWTVRRAYEHNDLRLQANQRIGIQRIFCVRHGERVDVVFGNKWLLNAFDQNGTYRRANLNLPSAIPNRPNPLSTYQFDSPITEIGAFQARLTGQALKRQSIVIDQCFSSPALRSVQTAHNILHGLGATKSVPIKIEPGLFEYTGWYERGMPHFISPDEFSALGYNIDTGYVSYLRIGELNKKEHYLDFYKRSFKTVLHAIGTSQLRALNFLFCGHAATLEVCTRQLCGRPPRTYQEFNNVIRRVGYLGMNVCERSPIDTSWRMREPPIPPIQYAGNPSFDWKVLL